jgi:hypothetical protein
MTEVHKPFSQMSKSELYQTVKDLKKWLTTTRQTSSEVDKWHRMANNVLDGIENKVDKIDRASKIASEVVESIDKCRSDAVQIDELHNKIKCDQRKVNITKLAIDDAASRVNDAENKINISRKSADKHLSDANITNQKIEKSHDEVRRLLPDAALANLTSSFRQAKMKYGDDHTIDNRPVGARWYQILFLAMKEIFSRNNVITLILYGGFIGALALAPIIFIAGPTIGLDQIFGNSLETFTTRLTIVLPVVWFATHMNRTINLRAKLYEEYNFKQRLATAYLAFVRQNRSVEQNKLFTNLVLEHLSKPPSITRANVYTENGLERIFRAWRGTETNSQQSTNDEAEESKPPTPR